MPPQIDLGGTVGPHATLRGPKARPKPLRGAKREVSGPIIITFGTYFEVFQGYITLKV